MSEVNGKVCLSMLTKIKGTYLLWILLLILPIIDSFNGLLNNGGNKGGISLGIIYRLMVMLGCALALIAYKVRKRIAIFYALFLGLLILSLSLNSRNMGQYLNLLVRLVLPLLIITAIESCVRAGVVRNNLTRGLFLKWRYWVPITIFIPYLAGMGFHTYENATGYKGLYYAQNDIGYILIILYLFSIYELSKKIEFMNVVAVMALLICNLLLGLKSNYILTVVITVLYFLKREQKRTDRSKKLLVMAAVMVGLLFILAAYGDKILLILKRWQHFYVQRDLISFLTSSRSERVLPAYKWMKSNLGFFGILCGSGVGYQWHTWGTRVDIIEMDLFDIFFQLGAIGVSLVYGFYFFVIKRYCATGFFKWGFWLSLLYSTLVGHVLESALSGMFFALLCCGSIFEYYGNRVNEKIEYI